MPLNRKTLRSSLRRRPACFAMVPYKPHKLFLLGFETATWHVWAPLKSFKSPAAAFEGLWAAKPSAAACEGVPPALPWYLPIGPTSCLYWASKLLRGTFWAPLKLPKPRSSFRRPLNRKALHSSLRRPPACFAMVPPYRLHKLSLLAFETATWHVLGTP